MGQGVATVLTQMVCHTLEISPDRVVAEPPDTGRTPDSGTTTASRQTLFSGEAAIIAAKKLRAEMERLYEDGMSQGEALQVLEGGEYYGEYGPETDAMGSDKPFPVSHVAYGYSAQVAELDDQGRVVKITAAYDVGAVVSPKAVQGQIEGGVVMGVGYALTEDYPLENGYPKAKFGTLGLFRATETPEIEIIIVDRDERLNAAYGAKGVGELAVIPSAPALQGAYYRFDGRFRCKLPMEDTLYRKKGK